MPVCPEKVTRRKKGKKKLEWQLQTIFRFKKAQKEKKTRMAIAKLFAYHANAKKKIMQFDWVLFFLLTQNLSFWLRILDNNTKWCIKMVITSNKSTFVLKNKFHLSIQPNMLWKIFGIFFFFFLIRSNLKSRILQHSKRNTKSLEAKGET